MSEEQPFPAREADLSGVRRYSIKTRLSKVSTGTFAKPAQKKQSFNDFFDSLPGILQAGSLRELVQELKACKRKGRPVYWMLGGHVIKVGLSPVLKGLIDDGYVQGLFINSAASIHDSEIARFGSTSEDVSEAIKDGSFGMAEETSVEYLQALRVGHGEGLGWGEAIARWLDDNKHPYRQYSLLAHAHAKRVPVTIHGALGTDIIWQHPELDGRVVGECGLRDFKKLIHHLGQLENGAVLNWGSAVIMPEVFLKAFTVARNLGATIEHFISANFDMIQHYRPRVNILERPTSSGGKKFALTGHHEIMMPLFAQALVN